VLARPVDGRGWRRLCKHCVGVAIKVLHAAVVGSAVELSLCAPTRADAVVEANELFAEIGAFLRVGGRCNRSFAHNEEAQDCARVLFPSWTGPLCRSKASYRLGQLISPAWLRCCRLAFSRRTRTSTRYCPCSSQTWQRSGHGAPQHGAVCEKSCTN